MSDPDWGGWRIPTKPDVGQLCIGHVPGRKQPCLYLVRGNEFAVLAYFKGDDQAGKAIDWVDAAVGEANACASALNKLFGGAA